MSDCASPASHLRRRLRRGDPAALDALLEEYWTPVTRYLSRFLDDDDGIEDVAQDCFVRLWTNRRQLDPDGSLGAMIFRIARNAALDARRKLAVRERAQPSLLAATPTAPDAAVEFDELRRIVDRAIASLPARRREVFVLLRESALTHREVAMLLGIAPQTVSNLMSLALEDLRRALDPHLSPHS